MSGQDDYLNTSQSVPDASLTEDERDRPERNRSTVLWGVTLVILGTLFFLDQIISIDWEIFHDWWPVALIVVGLFSGGHVLTAVGAWLLIAKLELFGLTFSTGWPVILMIIGAGILVDALRGGDKNRRCATFGQRGGSR